MDHAAVSALVAGVVLVASGVAIVVVGRMGRQGRLPRQHWAGIRTPSTMRSNDAWLAAHRTGGPLMEVAGWCAVVLGSAAALLSAASERWTTSLTLAAAGILLVLIVGGGIRGVRAARRVRS